MTGGAIRLGDFKLLVTNPGRAPWESSSPEGTGTHTHTHTHTHTFMQSMIPSVSCRCHPIALHCVLVTGQGTPGGRYPNGTSVFDGAATGLSSPCPQPVGEVYDNHLKRNITVWLFNIAKVCVPYSFRNSFALSQRMLWCILTVRVSVNSVSSHSDRSAGRIPLNRPTSPRPTSPSSRSSSTSTTPTLHNPTL